MLIAPNIHRIPCKFGGNRISFVHLFVGSEAVLLVDTCCAHNPEQDILPYLAANGIDLARLRYIITSHSDLDHQGGNQPMKAAAPHAVLMCHQFDRAWIEDTEALIAGRYDQFAADHGMIMSEEAKEDTRRQTLSAPVDLTLLGGERIRLSPGWEVEVVHTPGHTWGHLAVYDPVSKTLAAGEAALWTAILNEDFEPAMPPTYCYVDTYLATIDRLLSMDIQIYSPAHWPVQTGPDVAAFLQESRNYCLHLESELLKLAASGPITLAGACTALGPRVGRWDRALDSVLQYPLLGNLNSLTARGKLVTGRDERGIMTWSLAQ
ncbi:MAG: MBL fold metallo-hydrolase [Candidatus Flexifilum sp.]|jgi:glyoxylase-like metal-dependent hydrolase (beta-lactamase superfamily II)